MNLSDLIGTGGGVTFSSSGVYDRTKFISGFDTELQAIISANNGSSPLAINTALTGTGHYSHQMVIDKTNKIIYVYGGIDGAGAESDTLYKYDITTGTTTVLTTTLTGTTRFNHRMVIDETNQKLIVYGGRTGVTSLDDLITYDIAGATTTTIAGFTGTAREGAGMAFNEVTQILYIYGGSTGSTMLDDLLSYDFSATTPTITTLLSSFTGTARYYTQMVLDTVNNQLIVYGGGTGTVFLDDMYSYDIILGTSASISLALTGTAATRHTMDIDNVNSTINLYDGDIDTLYSYDIAKDTLSTINIALLGGVRQHSRLVTDSTNTTSYFYGGYDGTNAFDKLSSNILDLTLSNAKLLIPRIA